MLPSILQGIGEIMLSEEQHTLCGSLYVTHLEPANLQRQKSDQLWLRAGVGDKVGRDGKGLLKGAVSSGDRQTATLRPWEGLAAMAVSLLQSTELCT